jgi:hypothetical protein
MGGGSAKASERIGIKAMNSECAEVNPFQTTAYVRISAREHLNGWEALRLCARSEPGCTNHRATIILLQAFSSREVSLSHRNGPCKQVFGEQDWTRYTVDLQIGTIDHPSGVSLNRLHVSARGLTSWLAKQRKHVAVPKQGPTASAVGKRRFGFRQNRSTRQTNECTLGHSGVSAPSRCAASPPNARWRGKAPFDLATDYMAGSRTHEAVEC